MEEDRVRRTRGNRVDHDAASANLLGQGACEHVKSSLAASIGRIVSDHEILQSGSNIDDLALICDVLGGLAHEEGRLGVGGKRAVKLLLGNVAHVLLENNANIVDNNVDAAKSLEDLLEEALDRSNRLDVSP